MDCIKEPYPSGSAKGTTNTLVLNTDFECVNDGYVIAQTRGADGQIGISIYSSDNFNIGTIWQAGKANSTDQNMLFVKKGMHVKMMYKAGVHELNKGMFVEII